MNPFTFRAVAADEAGDEVFELGDALLDGRLQWHHPRLLRATHQRVQITDGLNSLAPNNTKDYKKTIKLGT